MQQELLLDVAGLAAELEGEPTFLPVIRRFRSARVVQSCVTDLRLAQDHIEALEHSLNIGGTTDETRRRTIETSLSITAALLYVRATDDDGRGGGRGSVKVAGKLSDAAKEAHKRLVRLRNTAIAHVHDEESPPEYAWRETMIFGRWLEGWNLGVTTRQSTSSGRVFDDLKLCLSEAEPILAAKAVLRINQLTEALGAVPAEVFDRHTTTAGAFFKADAVAAALLNSGGPGTGAIIHV